MSWGGIRSLDIANHARVRVHFVWALQRARSGGSDLDGAGRIGGSALLIEDRLSRNVGLVIAHEVGHCLGLDHRGSRRGWLMFDGAEGIGPTMPKRYVDFLNPG